MQYKIIKKMDSVKNPSFLDCLAIKIRNLNRGSLLQLPLGSLQSGVICPTPFG